MVSGKDGLKNEIKYIGLGDSREGLDEFCKSVNPGF